MNSAPAPFSFPPRWRPARRAGNITPFPVSKGRIEWQIHLDN
jgi:hypothetical protein